MGAMVEQC